MSDDMLPPEEIDTQEHQINVADATDLPYEDESFHAVVTDPPYGLAFMGKTWDEFEPKEYQNFCESWASEALRILKPGGHLLSFSGTRTYHRMATGVEDAGFIIRDKIDWMYGCLSEDTEILTKEGWKGKDGITTEDVVYSFDYESDPKRRGRVVKNNVNHVFDYPFEGELVHLKNDDTDQLLTPNHKVLSKTETRKQVSGKRKWYSANQDYRYVDAGLMRKGSKHTLPLSAEHDGKNDVGNALFAELLGWVITEGWFQEGSVNISQSSVNSDDVSRIRYILGRLNIEHSEYQQERKYKDREYIEHQFYINDSEAAQKIQRLLPNCKPTKELWNLPIQQKHSLIEGLIRGDGAKDSKTFYQDDMETLEWFMTLLHLSGYQARINKNKMCVEYEESDTTEIQGKHMDSDTLRKEYDGRVWCINTEVGNFFARRNGRIFITGNSGFPKNHDISKAIDKKLGKEDEREITGKKTLPNGEEHDYNIGYGEGEGYESKESERLETAGATEQARQWEGFGTALKPAHEPIVVARKPLGEDTIAEQVMATGTGALNIDGTRIATNEEWEGNEIPDAGGGVALEGSVSGELNEQPSGSHEQGRYPSNLIFDGVAAEQLDKEVGDVSFSQGGGDGNATEIYETDVSNNRGEHDGSVGYGDKGGPSRFFYTSKASKAERTASGKIDNNHPTVKPVDLMQYLVRLVTAEGQKVCDPFLGSGTTLLACEEENRIGYGSDMDKEYCDIATKRLGIRLGTELGSFMDY